MQPMLEPTSCELQVRCPTDTANASQQEKQLNSETTGWASKTIPGMTAYHGWV